MERGTAPEFSRRVAIDRIPARGMDLRIEASEAERRALALRFGLLSLDSLVALLRLKPLAGGSVVRLDGRLEAQVVQACVVSLEPVPARVEEHFSMTFSEDGEEDEEGDIEIAFEEDGPPEPFIDGAVDVGEAVAEHLALALDPFPRAPGAALPEACSEARSEAPAEPEPETRPSPFAALAALGQKKG